MGDGTVNSEDAKKLLGGYAMDTLTTDERRRLFEAALSDQEVFDALAREQTLKEALETPGAREQLLRAARIRPDRRTSRWIPVFRGPWPWAAAGATALITVLVVMLVRTEEPGRRQLAKVEPAPAVKSTPVEPLRREAGAPSSEPPRHAAKRPAKRNLPAVQSAPAPAAGGKEEALASPPSVQGSLNGGAVAGALSETRQPMMAARSAGGFAPMASVAPPGLQVSVMRAPEADALRARTAFHAGDSVQLRITPPFDGKVYVMRTEDSGANWTLAYSADARANVAQSAPLRLDTPGQTWLVVVLSRAPLAELAAAPPDRNLIDQVRRDAGEMALAKPATASANVPAHASRLVREIRLTVEP